MVMQPEMDPQAMGPQTPPTAPVAPTAGGDQGRIAQDAQSFKSDVRQQLASLMAAKNSGNDNELREQLIQVLRAELEKMGIDPTDPASMEQAQEFIATLPPDILAILSGDEAMGESMEGAPLKESLEQRAPQMAPDATTAPQAPITPQQEPPVV